jgi:hypothetical protein
MPTTLEKSPMGGVTVQEAEKALPSKKSGKPAYVALIYYPGIESGVGSSDHLITGIKQLKANPFCRCFQFQGQDGVIASITVHPGTNMGYHVRSPLGEKIFKLSYQDFQAIFTIPGNKALIDNGSIVAFFPGESAVFDGGVPQYSDFALEDAKKLLSAQTHEGWVQQSMVTEDRPEMKTLADKRVKEIVEIRRKLQEGN